ncbi:23S rRNA (uracil(1939)-C(5))-methyltransferase RlmD [Pantoea tagorei]
MTTKQRITVTVDELDPFGQGVARHQGKTLFISGALPGEQAEVTLVEEKRQYARGKATRLLSLSPERVTPRCPHFTRCGGCQQQHAAEPLQQRSKAAALSRMLSQAAQRTVAVDAILAGPAWGYRRRARLGLQWQPKTRELRMGFRQEASNDLVAIRTCPILAPELEALLLPLRDCLSALRAASRLGHLELVLADNGPLVVLRHLDALHADDREKTGTFFA